MRRLVYFAFVVAACGKHDRVEPAAAAQIFDQEIVLPTVPPGESDLTLDGSGHIWAIAERDRFASELVLAGSNVTVVEHAVDGVPDGNDTESIAWLGGSNFVLGIEGQETTTAGVLFAELRPDGHLVVTSTRDLTNAELGVTLQKNHGSEAICGSGDDIVVGIEERGTFPDGSKWAPLVRIKTGRLKLAKLHLTTGTGKLSALDCRFAADGSVDFVGIERHFGVERILHGVLAAGATEVTPTLVQDLAPAIGDKYNLEGIARLPDGRIALINDNQSKTIDGPTKLLLLKPRATP
ncbi:MAG TPA: hypothetical protein VGG28_07320 [Kofleriaceae bacterium]|jgi:hypothetical protein